MTPILDTKLPNVGTTIFTVMSALATEHQAVNLGQGFPDFGCDPALIDAVSDAMREGLNQYPSMLGVLELRQANSLRSLHQSTQNQSRAPVVSNLDWVFMR